MNWNARTRETQSSIRGGAPLLPLTGKFRFRRRFLGTAPDAIAWELLGTVVYKLNYRFESRTSTS